MSASTLACVGLGADDPKAFDVLLDKALRASRPQGRPGSVETWRWTDDSGAQLTAVLDGETVVDLVPGFTGQSGADLGRLEPFGAYAAADVVEDGETVTRIACALPQAPYLPRIPVDLTPAAVTALGVDVTVHADGAAFAASDASRLGDEPDGPRMAPESLLPHGLFADPDDAEPVAFVAGTVLLSETHTNSLTGQAFHAMLLRTVGMTVTLCLSAADHPEAPTPDQVVAGTCYLVADVPSLWKVQPGPRRRWLKSR